MRTGLIAQKLGMTRIFTDDGSHVPVTVLKVDSCQVVAVRTAEKDGYTAVQLGAGKAKSRRTSRSRCAATTPRPSSSPSASWSSSACRGRLIEVGAELSVEHFLAGQFVDVTGTTKGRGFSGVMSAGTIRRPARHPRRLGLASQPRLDRPAPGSRQGLQGQEDGRPPRRRARDDAKSARRSRTDAERGLIMVEGAVPGADGGYVHDQGRRQARRPKACPYPARAARGRRRPPRRRPKLSARA